MNSEFKWENEPNFLEFDYQGYLCQIIRNPCLLNLCGYVFLTKENKFFKKNYDDIDVKVHGGLTFSESRGENFWKIGFDCGHFYDICPGLDKQFFFSNLSTYKNIDYVKKEIKFMVDQIIEKNHD